MKTALKIFIPAVLALAALVACDRLSTLSGERPIAVQASIGAMTKVTTTGNKAVFDTGDAISIFAWTGSADAVPATRVVDGVKNTLGADGAWTPASPMLWQDMAAKHYFLGVFPARTVTDFKADPYTLDPSNYAVSDLLIATNLTGLQASDKPVEFVFDHALARLDVNLSFRNQWETAPTVTAVAATAKKTATVDYLSKTLTATGTAAEVALKAASNVAWSGLQVPQEGLRTITVKIDGKDYVYTHTADIPFAGGKYTTVNLILGRDKIELSSEITINDWTSQGDAIGGDVFKPAA